MTGLKIELFSCSGGMAEGFRRAGLRFDLAVDADPHACESYARNHGHRPLQRDVKLLLEDARAGWRPGPVALVVADPPCTPWSRAGKRLGPADPRDMLGATTELIGLLRPRAYLIGNVPGLDDSTQWHHVQTALEPLACAGYCIRDYASLDAADFGVPQHRRRPFWFGHLSGPCLRWPAPTHCDPSSLAQRALPGLDRALQPWVTCRQALQHLPLEQLGRPVRLKRNSPDFHPASETDAPARVIASSMPGNGGNVLVRGRKNGHPSAPLDGLAPTIRGGGEGHSAPQLVRARGKHPTSEADAPARTLRSDGGRAGRREGVLVVNDRHPPAQASSPVATIGAKNRGQGTVLAVDERVLSDRNRARDPDASAETITGAGRGNTHALAFDDLALHHAHAPSEAQEPGKVVPAYQHTSGGEVLAVREPDEWPWNRPATTVARDPRIAPPGHHDTNSYLSAPDARGTRKKRQSTQGPQSARVADASRPSETLDARPGRIGNGAAAVKEWPWDRPSTVVCAGIDKLARGGEHAGQFGPNAVVLSERAATILQGFPEDWHFAGTSKKARWSQLGQAMPPPLAHAVATSVVEQMRRTEAEDSQPAAAGATP